jgi:ribonuclease-3
VNAATAATLEARLGHAFRDRSLLARALTHPSRLQDEPGLAESNQRLEFLGDAVLQLVLSESLYLQYPAEREGTLSRHRAVLANGPFLAGLAREIDLDRALRLGASEESTGGRERPSSLEDAFEALLGAVFLDGGMDAARRVVAHLYGPLDQRLAAAGGAENPKGRLQELVQPEHGSGALRYEVLRTEGEDHARRFEVAVHLQDRLLGTGRGTSKKTAEEAAARAALAALQQSAPLRRLARPAAPAPTA